MAIWYKPWTWNKPREVSHTTIEASYGPWFNRWVCPECSRDTTVEEPIIIEGIHWETRYHKPNSNDPCRFCGSPQSPTPQPHREKTILTRTNYLDGYTHTHTRVELVKRGEE